MDKEKKIIFNTVIRWLGEIINKGLWFAFIIILARLLGSKDFGYFNYIFSLSALLVILNDLGTNLFLTKTISRDKKSGDFYLSNVFEIKIFLSIIIFFISVFIGLLKSDVLLILLIFILSFIASSFIDPINSIFRANKQLVYETLLVLLFRITSITLSFLGIYFLKIKLVSVSLSFFIASTLSLIIALLLIKKIYNIKIKIFEKINFENWHNIFKNSFPIGLLLFIGGILFKLNIVLLNYFKNPESVAYYSAAFKIIEGTFWVPSIFTSVLFPFLCENNNIQKLSDDNLKLFKKSTIFTLFISILLAITIFILSPQLTHFFYGSEYKSTISIFKILSGALIFIYLNDLILFTLLSIEKHKKILINFALGCLLYLILCITLIPVYGEIGAAWTLFISQVFLLFMNFILLARNYDKNSSHITRLC